MSATFEAKYHGHCHAGCLDPIEPGDDVTFVNHKLVHAECADDSTVNPRPVTICQACWLAKPCGCDDA
ncbi:hypothetical protein [Arthrobacter sp. USHLN218]|uniref:hypothetical protein n=1 Tax=Arthrobacter sp. USHLN218 TaxID=3081232 RepID=UPI003017767D